MKLTTLLILIVSHVAISKPARSVQITLVNNTNFNFVIVDHPNLIHGMWTKAIPTQIYPNQTVTWSSESRGFATGTEGKVIFYIYGHDCSELVEGELFLHWNNPYLGANKFVANTPQGFWIEQIGSGKGNRPTITWKIHTASVPTYRNPVQLPDDLITSLELKIKTANKRGAGTDNAVWFSIGPHSWNLDNQDDDFERGKTDVYNLFCPPNLGIRASDLIYYHLEKKGLGGYYGSTDRPDGEWFPDWIELKYNGITLGKRNINRWLASPDEPTWISLIQECKCIPFNEKFVHTLRLEQNAPVPGGRWAAGVITPLFKEGGVSGWIDLGGCNPENIEDVSVSVRGRVYRKPVISADGFATIDIELLETSVCGNNYLTTDFERFSRKRHIRIEYKIPVDIITGISVTILEDGKTSTVKLQIPLASRVLDPLYEELQRQGLLPREGCIIFAAGNLKWDTDNEGWYEVHPPKLTLQDC